MNIYDNEDYILWCPKCRGRRSFNCSGSCRSGTCLECGQSFESFEEFRLLADLATKDYELEQKTNKLYDFLMAPIKDFLK